MKPLMRAFWSWPPDKYRFDIEKSAHCRATFVTILSASLQFYNEKGFIHLLYQLVLPIHLLDFARRMPLEN